MGNAIKIVANAHGRVLLDERSGAPLDIGPESEMVLVVVKTARGITLRQPCGSTTYKHDEAFFIDRATAARLVRDGHARYSRRKGL